jgi:prevent-host-death family protein
MANSTERRSASSSDWTVASAKAKFSELVDRAQSHGPQTIARRGRIAAVVVSVAEWERKKQRSGTLADFFAKSPLNKSGLKIRSRPKTDNRTIQL